MKDCDKNWVRQEIEKGIVDIEKGIADKELFVTFDCPHCGHITIARKTITLPYAEYWDDRRCLVCGKLFIRKDKTEYEEFIPNKYIKSQ